MNKASPVDMRKSLKMVELFTKAGIGFVPMPITEEDIPEVMLIEMADRLDRIEKSANKG